METWSAFPKTSIVKKLLKPKLNKTRGLLIFVMKDLYEMG
jgi:hypothetical protein